MKKKRFLAVLLAAAMVFSLAACGGKSSSDSSSDKKADKEASTEEEIPDTAHCQGHQEAHRSYPDSNWNHRSLQIQGDPLIPDISLSEDLPMLQNLCSRPR